MSSAFDTIDRKLLLDILKDILDKDEMRLVRLFLSDTKISTKKRSNRLNAIFSKCGYNPRS